MEKLYLIYAWAQTVVERSKGSKDKKWEVLQGNSRIVVPEDLGVRTLINFSIDSLIPSAKRLVGSLYVRKSWVIVCLIPEGLL